MLKCHEIQRCFSGSPQGGRHSCTCSGGAQVLRGCPLGRGEDELQCPGVGSRGAEGFGNLEGVGIWTPLQRGERVSGCVQSCFSCLTLFDLINCSPPGSSVHGDSPGKNTGVDSHALLQGILPTQGSNLCFLQLLHSRQTLPLSHQEVGKRIFLNQPSQEVATSLLSLA